VLQLKKKYCKFCGKDAIVYIGYANLGLCREHFIRFYENRIRKMLEKHRISGSLMVCVSGGKDSMSLLTAIKRISEDTDLDVYAFHINLGIPNYSDECESIVKGYAKQLLVPTIVSNLKKDIGFSLPEIISVSRKPPCAACGIVRRWIINKTAYELGFDFVATGHNIDDASTFFLKALMTQDYYSILRGQWEFLEPKKNYRLVGRIRPQFYLSERENMLYAQLNNIPIVDKPCPYSLRATIHKYKKAWSTLLEINPVSQINLTKTLMKLRKMMTIEEPMLYQCKNCGYPTENPNGICSFCRLISRVNKTLHNNS